MPWDGFKIELRRAERGEDRGPGDAGWVEDVVDGAVAGRGRGEFDKFDDALGGVVNGKPRDMFVQFWKDTNRVCTLFRP